MQNYIRPAFWSLLIFLAALCLFASSCEKEDEAGKDGISAVSSPAGTTALKGRSAPSEVTAYASQFPKGPKVWVYAPRGGRLLDDIKESSSLKAFLHSRNGSADTFKRTRLFRKLRVRFKELARLVSTEAQWKDLAALVGEETAFALYDIGELKFVFISRLASDRMASTFLWPARQKAGERYMQGSVFYSLSSQNKSAELFFGNAKGKLVISNQESLFEEAFAAALAGEDKKAGQPLSGPFNQAFPKKFRVHDFLLFLEQDVLNEDPYFQRYWVYRNFERIDWVKTVVVDLELSVGKWKERRYYSADVLPEGRKSRDLGPCLFMLEHGTAGDCGDIAGAQEAATMLLSLFPEEISKDREQKNSFHHKLTKILSSSSPSLAGTALDVSYEDDALFWKNSYTLALKLDNPTALDIKALRQSFADALSDAVFENSDRNLDWKKDNFGTSCTLPLFESSGIWLDKRGDFLIASTEGGFHKRILEGSGSNRKGSFQGIYKSRLDFQKGSGKLEHVFTRLENYSGWPHWQSERSMSYLLELADDLHADKVNRQISYQGGLIEEKLSATPSY